MHGVVESALALLAVTLIASVCVGLLLIRFRQSVLIGYFLCGVAVGPGGFDLGFKAEDISLLSEIGIVLLMFTLGIEFSFGEVKRLKRTAVAGGFTQIFVSAILLAGAAMALGLGWKEAAIAGLLGSLSSTAVVLRVFQESGTNSPAGRIAVGIAIAQDIFAILLTLLLPPLLGGASARETAGGLLFASIKAILFLVTGGILSRYVIPVVLERVSGSRSRELFTLTVIGLCAGIAWLASAFGLSLALGAFVAGLIVSETVYSHKILSDILPFKDFFLTLFFVSIGMMIDLRFCIDHGLQLLAATAVVLLVKSAAGFLGGFASGAPARPATMAGFGLSSIGEFAFVVLSTITLQMKIPQEWQQGFLACATLSMGATPLLVRLSNPVGKWLEQFTFFRPKRHRDNPSLPRRLHSLENHAVICGHGPIGENLNRTLREIGVQTLVIELNATTVKRLIEEGQPCLYADIAQFETMTLSGIENARVLAITVPNFEAATSAVKSARELNKNIFVVCRARFPHQVQTLRDLGVQAVINEEAEISFEIINQTLQQYEKAPEEIAEIERELRFRYGVEN